MHYPFSMLRITRALGLGSLLLGAIVSFARSPATPYQYIRVGSATDASVTPRAGYALMGGGTDLDEAFKWLCDRAPGGDFLILRAHGDDAYNPYVEKLCKLNSVATLILPSREAALDPFAAKAIAHASVIFIAGGDQANYINFWMGTPVQAALNDAIRRGVPVGGTSAGLAVMGEWAYSAQGDKPDDKDLDSKTVLANPFHPRVTLVQGFLDIPILKNVITDTHFAKRDRMGRFLVFLAQLKIRASSTPHSDFRQIRPIRGIAVQERAAVLLEPDGRATVVGRGPAYFADPKEMAQGLQPNLPLRFHNIDIQRVDSGHTFNLKSWSGDATRYTLSIESGVILSTQPGGAVY